MVTTVRESSYRRSFKPGLLLSLGHALAEAPVTILLTYGLLNVGENVYSAISIVGGAVLVAMGLLAVLKPGKSLEIRAGSGTHGCLTMVVLGATVSASNPYWITWWLTIGAAYISKSIPWGALGIVLFYFSHETGDLAVLGSVSKLVASGTEKLGERGLKTLLVACNVVIIAIGISFVLEGMGLLGA
jgi:threonine/homoserine/homoserine lactone efflux protein